MGSGDLSDVKLGFSGFVYQDWAALSIGVVAVAAPWPLMRVEHQSAFYRVAVHITEFFDSLLFCEYHEVVETALPDVSLFYNCAPQGVWSKAGAGA